MGGRGHSSGSWLLQCFNTFNYPKTFQAAHWWQVWACAVQLLELDDETDTNNLLLCCCSHSCLGFAALSLGEGTFAFAHVLLEMPGARVSSPDVDTNSCYSICEHGGGAMAMLYKPLPLLLAPDRDSVSAKCFYARAMNTSKLALCIMWGTRKQGHGHDAVYV